MLLRSLRRLTPQVQQCKQSDKSLFTYLKTTGAEVVGSNNPSDLESLVRIVSAIDSFKYPAFNPAIQELVKREGDEEWIKQLQTEINNIPQVTALKYFKALAPAQIPSELLLTLIRRVSIQSRNDLSDFISAIGQLTPAEITPDVRRATTYVINKAVLNNCKLGTYNQIFELLNKVWRSTRRHLVPTKLRNDLVDAAWGAFIRLDMSGKDSEFSEAVKWLSMSEKVTGRKDEIDEMLTKVEARSKSFLQPDLCAEMLASILQYRRNVIPEPLDSIAQLLVRKLSISKLSVTELEQLVKAMTAYFTTRTKAPQLESMVETVLPRLLSALERNISNLPSRCMPAVLELVARSGDSSLVMIELEKRGHEMNGLELVRLINSMDWVDSSILTNLFSAKLGETKYVEGLIACLTVEEKVELLSSLAIGGVELNGANMSILTTGLKESILNGSGESCSFGIGTLVKMAGAGDGVFASTGLVPSNLVKSFLESEESASLNVPHTLRLLSSELARDNVEIAKSLFNHIQAAAGDLDVGESIDLLRAALISVKEREYVERALKILIPQLGQISSSEIVDVVHLLPSELSAWSLQGPQYSPSNQFKEEVLNRIAELVGDMDAKSISSSLIQLGRLGFQSQAALSSIFKRGLQVPGPLVSSPSEAVEVVSACRKLGMYCPDFLDIIARDFFRFTNSDSSLTTSLGTVLTEMGNKNETVLIATEQLLRTQSSTLDISTKISLLNTLAKNSVFSPLFVDQLRTVLDEASMNVSALSDGDWNKLFETHLVVLVESPPKIKVRFANDSRLKQFVDENCAFSWYASQEKIRTKFIYSPQRCQIGQAMEALGWENMRVPELGKEVYHVDFIADKVAVVTVPAADELSMVTATGGEGVRIIVGQSMTKIKHLQLFGYKVVPVWLKEWSSLASEDERKKCLLRNSTQVVYALGTGSR